ncbi:MAG: peptidoglycan-binding protein [Clostridia bacterium]|nr:peptidoglycan-binding protein [Clostridia bacterium]
MSYLDITDEKNFILQIQRMLRDISYLNYDDASQGITGVYDTATRHSVTAFQRDMGLAPTGKVDTETWEILSSVHSNTINDASVPRSVYIFPRYSSYEILPDTKNSIIYVLQHMLNEISVNDESGGALEMTGIYDKATQDAVYAFKRRNLLDDTSVIDVATLNRLFDEYEIIISSSK